MRNPAFTIPNQSTSLRLLSQPFLQPAWQLMRMRLEGFHVWAAYKMARVHRPKKGAAGVWHYPGTADFLEESINEILTVTSRGCPSKNCCTFESDKYTAGNVHCHIGWYATDWTNMEISTLWWHDKTAPCWNCLIKVQRWPCIMTKSSIKIAGELIFTHFIFSFQSARTPWLHQHCCLVGNSSEILS